MDEAKIHEIVIIKRVQSDGEDAHHGGVWKIAFADFMTAMMAFFLVMWLISANDKTKATIARYFNPVQLVDATPQPPGLSDPKAGVASVVGKDKPSGEKSGKDSKPGAGQSPVAADEKNIANADKAGLREEAKLFQDPYAVLAELAAKNSTQPSPQAPTASTEGNQGGSGAVGSRGGEAYRDPFEPVSTASSSEEWTESASSTAAGKAGTAVVDDPTAHERAQAPERGVVQQGHGQSEAADRAVADDKRTTEIRAKVAALVPAGAKVASTKVPHIDVQRTAEGLLIDITDGANFSMFASASASPAPPMVALMDKVGQILRTERGKITIRGFTDSQPFKSEAYDNWRLSSARAHMAHYMLVRGGLDEGRFDSVEGYADRRPKNPKNPDGPENRRIEILLRDPIP